MRLFAHLQMQVTQVSSGECGVTLIGYLLDPDNPKHSDEIILRSLSDTKTFFQNPYRATRKLGGRWLIIIQQHDETLLFADPAGLRQLFYTKIGVTKTIHCASEPGLLANVCGFSIDPEAEDFQQSSGFQANKEYWWPGDRSCFSEVKRLLPNFSLNPNSGERKRFWPVKPIEPIEKKEAIEVLGKRLPSFMEAISHRGKVAVSITAGLDSRMVLAASKSIVDRFEFMTVQQQGCRTIIPIYKYHAYLQITWGLNIKPLAAREALEIRFGKDIKIALYITMRNGCRMPRQYMICINRKQSL